MSANVNDAWVRKPDVLADLGDASRAVIEASAGTGKTYTLEHVVVDALLTREVGIDEILVVTFTEKATVELRAKLRKRIKEIAGAAPDPAVPRDPRIAWRIDDDARARLERALASFDAASISTIHGFCQRVLAENAFASGRLFAETSVDSRQVFARAFRDALRADLARPGRAADLLRAALENGIGLAAIEELLRTVYEHRGDVRLGFDETVIARAVAAFPAVEGLAEALAAEIAATPKIVKSTRLVLERSLPPLIAAFARYRSDASLPALLGALRGVDFDHLEMYLGRVAAPSRTADLLAAIANLNAASSLHAALVHDLLPPVRARLGKRKREAGLFDFDDMLLLVRDALRSSHADDLTAALRRRYKIALIDEFQDTDEVQWEIFRKVFFEGTSEHTLYLIGDPKQAIYAFRGGDVQTYLAAKAALSSANGEVVALTKNFRSTPLVIEAYNRILDQRAVPPFFDGGEIGYDHPVECGKPHAGPGGARAPVTLLHLGEGCGGVGAVRDAVAERIADEIVALLGLERAGPADPPNPAANARRPERLRARDIFVLTGTAHEGRGVGDALRRVRVPFAFFKEDGLFQSREARALSTLLQCLADPLSRSRRRQAWLSAFFNVALVDVERVDALPPTHPLPATLLALRALAEARALEPLFTAILRDTGALRRAIFEGNERAITNYLHILEILLAEANRTGGGVGDVAKALDAFIAQRRMPVGDESANVQRLESEEDAVQIMTMHKSKGLEAEVVFVAGALTARQANGLEAQLRRYHEGRTRLLFVGNAPAALTDAAKREAREEHQRLLYVAMTRAKARLVMPMIGPIQERAPAEATAKKGAKKAPAAGAPKPPADAKITGAYATANDRLLAIARAAVAGNAPLAPHFDVVAVTSPDDDAERAERTRASDAARTGRLASWRPPRRLLVDAAPEAPFAELAARRAGFAITSYSQMKRAGAGSGESDPRAAEPTHDKYTARDVVVVGEDDPLPGGAATGIFLHEVLEGVDLPTLAAATSLAEWQDRPEARAVAERAAERQDVDLRHVPRALEIAYRAFAGPVRLGAAGAVRIAESPRTRREMEFLYPYPETATSSLASAYDERAMTFERGFVRGFIDLVFEHDGRAYVLDWKSDRLPRYDAPRLEAHVAEHYALQARLYTLALVKVLGIHDEAAFTARFGGVVYVFLRGLTDDVEGRSGVSFTRPSWLDVLAWERELAGDHATLPLRAGRP